jgi:hypothetical protein
MTLQRQENKARRFKIAAFAAICGLLLFARPDAVRAAATERVVTNRQTGLAIDGYDPVAYFTDGMATQGLPDVELSDRGVVWRFRNEANRTVFKENPDVYSPRFGGYDAVDMAKGNPVPGRAQFWVIYADRLYLFNREENLTDFTAEPKDISSRADAKWPDVRKTLSDY